MTPVLSLQAIGKTFEPGVPVLQDVTLHIAPGAMVCLLGPSGCGKTTLLRLVAGFEQPDVGTIHLGGELVSRRGHVVAPEKRQIGMVFQDYALFPHMTVAQNIVFGLFRRPAAERDRRLADLLQLVGLEDMAARYPHELSGGQQQRVALARALAPDPQLLLLDEPFSNLDVNLRRQLRQEMQEVLRQTDMTTILVTHDQEEALSLADTLAILDRGRVVQFDVPEAIVQRPSTRFVAEFLVFVGVFQEYLPLAALAVVGAAITAVYILRLLAKAFFGPLDPRWEHLGDATRMEWGAGVMLAFVLIFVGVWPAPLMDVINSGVNMIPGVS